MDKWPSFTLVHLSTELDDSVSEGVRMVANDLTRQGVPKEIFEGYRAAEAITQVVLNQKRLLRFGRVQLYSSMCMDVATRSIVELAPDLTTGFVNSSLGQFTETAKAVIARFPFYGENDAEDVTDRAVKEVTDAIRSVDESAFARDGFWATLVDDIRMGDFTTEWIVSQRFAP